MGHHPRGFTLELLRHLAEKTSLELAVGLRLSAANFKACTEKDSVLSTLKSRLSNSEKLGVKKPFGILMNSDDTWSLLSPKQPYLSQITRIAEASKGDS